MLTVVKTCHRVAGMQIQLVVLAHFQANPDNAPTNTH